MKLAALLQRIPRFAQLLLVVAAMALIPVVAFAMMGPSAPTPDGEPVVIPTSVKPAEPSAAVSGELLPDPPQTLNGDSAVSGSTESTQVGEPSTAATTGSKSVPNSGVPVKSTAPKRSPGTSKTTATPKRTSAPKPTSAPKRPTAPKKTSAPRKTTKRPVVKPAPTKKPIVKPKPQPGDDDDDDDDDDGDDD